MLAPERGNDMSIQCHRKTSHWHIAATICLAVILSIVTGCTALNTVKQSNDETNKELLKIALPDPTEKSDADSWKEPSAEIDAYIAAHPDNKQTASSLRIRQAMLLLAHKQYDLASAAFDQATDLHLARDKALKALEDELIWWFKVDQNVAPDGNIGDTIAAFSEQIANLNGNAENESVRDYLAEMRAWIQLYTATHAINERMLAADLASAMDNYAETLTDTDIGAINNGATTPGIDPTSQQARRQTRAMLVVTRAAELAKDLKLAGVNTPYQSEKSKNIIAIN